MRKVLIRSIHGLGDAVQLTSVLRHIKQHRRDWIVDIVSKIGKHTCFNGLCRKSFAEELENPSNHDYDEVFDLGWYENYNRYSDRPNTKVTNSLAEEFGIDYDLSLAAYHIGNTPVDRQRARDYFDSIGAEKGKDRHGRERYKVVVFHYEGNTSPDKKNLHPSHVKAAIHTVLPHGYKAVILDWDHRSNLADPELGVYIPEANHPYWTGTGTGDACRIKSLVDEAMLFVGIDSGPGHAAGASDTPSIIVWRGHHPFQFYDPCPSVRHLVPDHHCHFFDPSCFSNETKRAAAKKWFDEHYRFVEYPTKHRDTISTLLRKMVIEELRLSVEVLPGGLVDYRGMKVREGQFAQDQEIVEDVMFNDSYQVRHYDPKTWKLVVDVGAQIGTFAKMIHAKNPECRIICVEASTQNLDVLRANVGDFAEIVPKAMTGHKDAGGTILFSDPSGDDRPSTGGGSVLNEHYAGKNIEEHITYEVPTCSFRELVGDQEVDCLKLDCEGSEYAIIEPEHLKKVKIIFGEWHGSFDKFNTFRQTVVPGYDFGDMSQHNEHTTNGVFHLAPR